MPLPYNFVTLSGRSIFCLLIGISLAVLASGTSTYAQTAISERVEVVGQAVPSPTPEDTWPKLNHIMREVSGTQITVTKKATVIKLDHQPTVVNNNQQQLFSNAPGVLVTEQQTPGQFNISYRGLGNPQESEYILALQDGLPLMTDWIGFPTLYYTPLPQSIGEIQVIRGGSSLLYGPEPAPAINYISRRPAPGSPMTGYTEQVGGGYGLYSTYNVLQGTHGAFEYRAEAGYVRQDGQRDNGDSELFQSNVYLAYRPDAQQLWAFDVNGYRVSVGDPGRITIQQFNADPNATLTPYNHDWVDRVRITLTHEHEFGDDWLLQAKAWFTYQAVDNRTAANISPTGAFPTTTTIQSENYYNGGADIRLRKRWGEGNALTFGGVVYHGDSPFQQYISDNLFASRDSTGMTTRLDQDRTSDYQAIFAENVFRFGKFHVVPSFRLDHETVEVSENVSPFRPSPGHPLADVTADRTIPLWGIGFGNDFGKSNETYFSASSGWRPVRYFDTVSPFSPTFTPGHPNDPFKSLDFELGVHGTPIPGFWYDVGLFWMEFSDRTESVALNPGVNNDTIQVNSGDTRHRGFEGELSYDLLELWQNPALAGSHLIISSNLQVLDAEFTDSTIPNQIGKTPAFAPDVVFKGAITFRKDNCYSFRLSATAVSSQFFQDSNLPATAADGTVLVPAKVPSYWTLDFSGEYYFRPHCRILAGVSNLTNERYYDRVFSSRIEPAPGITGYGGVSIGF